MAYIINGKVHTSHPLMDEIVHSCKIILDGIVLKNEKVANNNETADSITESDAFLAIMNDAMHLEILPISEQFLLDHGFNNNDAINIARDITRLPEYVECTLSRYDDKDTRSATWNAEYARYELITGEIAGKNINTSVTIQDGKFVYSDGSVCDGHVIALKEEYYIDPSTGNIVLQDSEDSTKFYNIDGTEFLVKPTKCMAGIIREFANYYPRNEQNLYYRTLSGLPAYGTNDYDVYVDYDKYQYLLELDDNNADFKFDLPIHEFSDSQILTLESLGILDDVIDEYYTNALKINKPYYRYLTFLGNRKIDLYTARSAKEWDILYMPPVEHLVSDRFKEAYKINRDIYYRRTYQQAYSIYSDYYEELVMIMIVCQTFTDLVVDTPEFYIRRDVFDLRTAQYFLEANGVEFYADIPLKYQVLLIKNLNKLIKYKSTMQNINDILDIFSMSDSIIYKFYLFKKYLYNAYELPSANDVLVDDINETGWQRTDLIKNGDFETGDLEHWEATMSEYPDQNKVGFRITMEPVSAYNITPYLAYYNKTPEYQEFSLTQTVHEVPIGTYRIRARLAGTARLGSGARFYINDTAIMGVKITKGNEWIDVVSNEFSINSISELTVTYKGAIASYYEGKIDEIRLEEYVEILDFGDEDEIEGHQDMTNVEIYDFYDENGTDEYPTQLYLFDFGNEDSDVINTGEVTDAEFDFEEANRVIYDESGNVYDLEFVKVPLGEGYDDYIKDSIYRQQYDSVVRQDKYWNGEDTHNYIKNLHLAKDFTIEGSKFMGLEFNISYQEYAYQKQYYLGMYMNADLNTNDIKITVPSIKQNAQFSLQNLIIFIYCCNGLYDVDSDTNIVDTTSKFIKYTEKEEFKPRTVIDGGHPWDEGTGQEYEEPEEEPWETPDLDFGDEEDPEFEIIKDQFLEILDFGYHVDIDYNDPNLEIYDFGDEDNDLSEEDKIAEAEEPDIWPFQDLCDFGCEDLDTKEDINGDISVPVVRSKLTKLYDFVDEDEWVDPDIPVDRTEYIYDFNAKTVGTVDYIENPNDPIYNEDQLIPEPPKDYFPAYYVENADLTVFKLYDYDENINAYRLIKDYGSGVIEIPWEYDIKDIITQQNYIQYLSHYAIDLNTGEYTKLTRSNYKNYLGQLVYMRFPWYATPPGIYTRVIDGHHNMQDEDHDDVKFNKLEGKWFKLDGSPANGVITQIDDKYKQMIDGGETIYTLDDTKQAYYDWLRFEYPSRWIPLTGRIYGFNMSANLNQLAINIGERHSLFGWSRGFTLEECGVADFIVKSKVSDLSEMYIIYETNTKCYYNLIEKMENASTRDERQVLDYLYYSLYTKPFDQEMYMLKSGDIADTYDQILAEKDYTLYNYYLSVKNEKDPDVRQQILRDTLNDLVDTLSYYISGSNLEYVLTFITTSSTDAVLGYMMEIINFFKSWKVYFLDPHNTYIVNDKYNHMIYSGDTITEMKVSEWHTDTFAARDSLVINTKYEVMEENKILAYDGTSTSNTHKGAQVVDIASHYIDENPLIEKNIDGNTNNIDPFTVLEGNVPEESPFYVVDGGRSTGRHDVYMLDCGGAGLLSREEYVTGKENNTGVYTKISSTPEGEEFITADTHEPIRVALFAYGPAKKSGNEDFDITYVNLPRPRDDANCVVIDGNESWEDESLGYAVDGGRSSHKRNFTRTTITSVDDENYITVEARLSTAPDNAITIEEDGIFVNSDNFVSKEQYKDTIGSITVIRDDVIHDVTAMEKTLFAVSSPEAADYTIDEIYSDYFKKSKYVLGKLGNNDYEHALDEKSTEAAEQLIEWFKRINPFAQLIEKVMW